MSSNQFDQRVLELVNEERAEAGVNPLELDSRLDRAANLHNDEMVRSDIMDHQVSGEAGLGDRVTASGYNFRNVAENISVGSKDDPVDVMERWMKSPGHKKNILNPNFTRIGIGYEDAPDNRPFENGNTRIELGNGEVVYRDFDTYWTQVFAGGDDNDPTPQEQSVDKPEPTPEEQPVDEVDEPEPTPEEQPVDEVDESEPTPEEQPVDKNDPAPQEQSVDEPEPTPEEQPVDKVDDSGDQAIDEMDEPEVNPEGQPGDEGENFDEMILDLFNAERAAAGLDLLEIDNQLDQAANLHTNEMVQADRLSHQLPGEASFGDRVSATGYEWRGLSQSVAGGFEDPKALVNALMDNPSSKASILNPNYTHLGAGYEEAPDDIASDADIYWTQIFGMDASSMS